MFSSCCYWYPLHLRALPSSVASLRYFLEEIEIHVNSLVVVVVLRNKPLPQERTLKKPIMSNRRIGRPQWGTQQQKLRNSRSTSTAAVVSSVCNNNDSDSFIASKKIRPEEKNEKEINWKISKKKAKVYWFWTLSHTHIPAHPYLENAKYVYFYLYRL